MAAESSPFDRFVVAQARCYADVTAELRAGEKTSHWMWFVFPQLRGLGRSPMAQQFAISSREEARAYLDHPLLGPRLVECTRLVMEVRNRSLHEIFGSPDDLKFRSSMTLFAQVAPEQNLFDEAIRKYCSGEMDRRTLELLD